MTFQIFTRKVRPKYLFLAQFSDYIYIYAYIPTSDKFPNPQKATLNNRIAGDVRDGSGAVAGEGDGSGGRVRRRRAVDGREARIVPQLDGGLLRPPSGGGRRPRPLPARPSPPPTRPLRPGYLRVHARPSNPRCEKWSKADSNSYEMYGIDWFLSSNFV